MPFGIWYIKFVSVWGYIGVIGAESPGGLRDLGGRGGRSADRGTPLAGGGKANAGHQQPTRPPNPPSSPPPPPPPPPPSPAHKPSLPPTLNPLSKLLWKQMVSIAYFPFSLSRHVFLTSTELVFVLLKFIIDHRSWIIVETMSVMMVLIVVEMFTMMVPMMMTSPRCPHVFPPLQWCCRWTWWRCWWWPW